MVFRRLLLSLGLLVAAGCAVGEPAPDTTPVPPAPTATQAPPPGTAASPPSPTPSIRLSADDLTGLEISFWHPWDGTRGELLNGLVQEFNDSNPYGITVLPSRHADLFPAVSKALQGYGEPPPDLVVGFNYHAAAWRDLGNVVDLSPYLSDPTWGLTEPEKQGVPPGFLEQAAPGGVQTGLPFYRTADVLLYNHTWALELGFPDAPDTPDALRVQACAANTALRADGDPGNDRQGGIMLGFSPTALITWLEAFEGGFLSTVEGEGYRFDRAENVAAFTYLRTLLDDTCAWTPEDEYPHADFAARRGLFLSTTLAGVPFQQAAMEEAGSTDEWTVIPYPGLGGQPSVLYAGPDFVVLAGPEDTRLAAWVFARWMSDPDHSAPWFRLTGYYPARADSVSQLQPTLTEASWIPAGTAFPADPNWPEVQWVVSDMARSLFAPLNTVNEVPLLLEELETLAEEVTGRRPQ